MSNYTPNDESDPDENTVLKALGDRFKEEPGTPITDAYLAETTKLHPTIYLGALYRLAYAGGPYIQVTGDFLDNIVEDEGKIKTGQEHNELLKIRGLTELGWSRYHGIGPAQGGGPTGH